ncbi:YheV family putative zinc ribbon protein [Bacterioplanoides pacificum]|uniref:YheV family putative zinc ribbon protein n=1 Tax=Bacterioplanoides pacificum TaxID=1171596 RepID=A0ABV7VPA0_9GAMM
MEYQPKKKPKRFVAGAVCPKCSEMDRTVLYTSDDGDEVRECISCGFKQTASEQAAEDQARQLESEALATRVTPLGKAVLDEDEAPLKILGIADKAD